jgi:hypothetical protein
MSSASSEACRERSAASDPGFFETRHSPGRPVLALCDMRRKCNLADDPAWFIKLHEYGSIAPVVNLGPCCCRHDMDHFEA